MIPAFTIQEATKREGRIVLVKFLKTLSFAYLGQLEKALAKVGGDERTVVILDMSRTASFLKYAAEAYVSSLTKVLGTQKVVFAGLTPEIVEYVVKRQQIPVRCFEPDVVMSLEQRGFCLKDFPGVENEVKGTGLLKSITRWFGSRHSFAAPREKLPHEVRK